jgi:Protein of unknown function DUF262/Protein of unknown function (DUF1524)
MLSAETYRIKQVFSPLTQYVVPPYQRNYVWDKRKWTRLWLDIRAAAERVDRPHFFGAIVIRNDSWAAIDGPRRFMIVDGQQRLTTTQVFLAALRDLAVARRLPDIVKEEIRDVTTNIGVQTVRQQLKVLPALINYQNFREVLVGPDPADEPPADRSLSEAHRYFIAEIGNYVDAARDPAAAVANILQSVRDRLYLVVLTLDDVDDAQAIYERLNSAGVPLRSSELIRNHLLDLCVKRGNDLDQIYRDYWAPLDDIPPSHRDNFLRSYLIAQTGREVQPTELFANFRDYAAQHEANPIGLLEQVARFGAIYSRFADNTGLDGIERQFAAHQQATRVFAFMPVVVRLCSMYSPDERAKAFAILDSYLVRRHVCSRPATGYTRMAVTLIKKLDDNPDDPAAVLNAYFMTQQWPTDEAVRTAIRTWETGTRPGTKFWQRKQVTKYLILLAESQLNTRYVEQVEWDLSKLTIEHLMPQGWHPADWPLRATTKTTKDKERRARGKAIFTLGNLTLTTEDLNGHLGNKRWDRKHQALTTLSRFELNRDARSTPADFATAADILKRGDFLAELICGALPHGSAITLAPNVPSMDEVSVDDLPVEDLAPEGLVDEIDADDLSLSDQPDVEELETDHGEEPDEAEGSDDSNGTNNEAEQAPVEPTGPPALLPTIDTTLRPAVRIRAALRSGPLTYEELAATAGLDTERVRSWLDKDSIASVMKTTKDGQPAGVLRPSKK